MRKVLLTLAVLAMISAPAFAAYTVGPIMQVPKGTNTSSPHRPAVDGDFIAATQNMATGNWGGEVYNTKTATMDYAGVGAAQFQCILGGYDWSTAEDIAGNYAVFGGAPTMQSVNQPIVVLNRSTGATMNIVTGNNDEHLTQVNKLGEVIWQDWGNGPADTVPGIMYSNVSSGTPTAPVQIVNVVAGDAGTLRLVMASDARRFAYRPDNATGASLWVYDLSAGTNTRVFTTNGDEKAFHPGLDDSGNWMVSNVRSIAVGGLASDIYLFNVADPSNPTQVALFNNRSVVRNDPRMEVIGPDEAIVVYDQSNDGGATYFVKAAFVQLSTGTVLSDIQVSGAGTCRFADVDINSDGNILVSWINKTNTQLEYATIIPEPATLALLGLGVLALARRR